MRLRLPLGRMLLWLCIFILALIALIPMQLGLAWLDLDERGLAARDARGSIWNGALVETQFGDAEVGDVDAGLNFFPLLIGRARLSVEREMEGDVAGGELSGAITVSGDDLGLDDIEADMAVAGMFAPLPVTSLILEDVTAHFESGLCVKADGAARIAIAGEPAGFTLPGSMVGTARCDEGALLLAFVGQSGTEQVNLRIQSSGAYSSQILVRTNDQALGEQLIGSGFVLGREGYGLTIEGQF